MLPLKTLFLGLFFFSITQNVENRLAINMAYIFVYIHVHSRVFPDFYIKRERRDDRTMVDGVQRTIQDGRKK